MCGLWHLHIVQMRVRTLSGTMTVAYSWSAGMPGGSLDALSDISIYY